MEVDGYTADDLLEEATHLREQADELVDKATGLSERQRAAKKAELLAAVRAVQRRSQIIIEHIATDFGDMELTGGNNPHWQKPALDRLWPIVEPAWKAKSQADRAAELLGWIN